MQADSLPSEPPEPLASIDGKITNKTLFDLADTNFNNICSGYESSNKVTIEISGGIKGDNDWYISSPNIILKVVDKEQIPSENYYEYEIKSNETSNSYTINPIVDTTIDNLDSGEYTISACSP